MGALHTLPYPSSSTLPSPTLPSVCYYRDYTGVGAWPARYTRSLCHGVHLRTAMDQDVALRKVRHGNLAASVKRRSQIFICFSGPFTQVCNALQHLGIKWADSVTWRCYQRSVCFGLLEALIQQAQPNAVRSLCRKSNVTNVLHDVR